MASPCASPDQTLGALYIMPSQTSQMNAPTPLHRLFMLLAEGVDVTRST